MFKVEIILIVNLDVYIYIIYHFKVSFGICNCPEKYDIKWKQGKSNFCFYFKLVLYLELGKS